MAASKPNLQQPSTASTTPMSDEQTTKLAIAIALLRSKLPPPSSPQIHRWKQKAKDRKQEISRLNDYLNDLQKASLADLYPRNAACNCYFFSDSAKLSPNLLVDHRGLNDALRRRFIRQVRLSDKRKRRASGSVMTPPFTESDYEDSVDQLRLSADFLVDLCSTSSATEGANFANCAHQAVDCILGSLKNLLSVGNDAEMIQATVNSLVVRLVTKMSTPLDDGMQNTKSNRPQDVQHIIRKLGRMSHIGQRVIIFVSQQIPEFAENLLHLDPFDASFTNMHDSMFLMIQLIEFMISDYLQCWADDESFDNGLFEEWVALFRRAHKALELHEDRMGLYILYLDRVNSGLARELGQASCIQKVNPEVVQSLFN